MQALLATLSAEDPSGSPATFEINPMFRPRYHEIEKCRLCGNTKLVAVLSLGEQALSGIFPRGLHATPTKGPLELVACASSEVRGSCGLVQLCQSYEANEIYGDHYGYRSASSTAHVRHLHDTVQELIERFPVQNDDLVVDLGSNDGTLLSFYAGENVTAIGFDPVGEKFTSSAYSEQVKLIPNFFSGDLFREHCGTQKARIVTSISVFDSVPNPLGFMREIAAILEDEGVWHFETNYLPSILRGKAYDAICHEHLEYYSLRQIKWMTDRCELKILQVNVVEADGGRIAVTVARRSSAHLEETARVETLLQEEAVHRLTTIPQQRAFESAVTKHRTELLWLLHALKSENHTVLGYGATTNGNVLLQHCGITCDLLPAIIENDPEKIGCLTPGTHIPIISSEEVQILQPEYLLVLSWRDRETVIEQEAEFLQRGGKMIFPLPAVEVVG